MTYRNLSKSLSTGLSLLPLAGFGATVCAADGAAKADVLREQFNTRQHARLFKADEDENKLVSKNKFLATHRSCGSDKLSRRFDRMDLNTKGSIDFGELTMMLGHRFKRLDKDGNGMLSETERATSRVQQNG